MEEYLGPLGLTVGQVMEEYLGPLGLTLPDMKVWPDSVLGQRRSSPFFL